MAGAKKRDDEDNILAHLLPLPAGAVSPFVEEDEEEVNYSETDEDLQSVDLPGRGRRDASLGGRAQEERWASLAAVLHTSSRFLAARISGMEQGGIKQVMQWGGQPASRSATLGLAKPHARGQAIRETLEKALASKLASLQPPEGPAYGPPAKRQDSGCCQDAAASCWKRLFCGHAEARALQCLSISCRG